MQVCPCKFSGTLKITLHKLYYPFLALGALYFKSVTNYDKFLKGKYYCKMKSYVFLKALLL